MIVKKSITMLILSVSLISVISGASYSKVFVESDTSPTRYYQYGAPYDYTSIASPQYSQINTFPASSSAYITPCVAPCIVPGASITDTNPINPPANILKYNSPYATIPVALAPAKEATTGYEYSYAVYDENTGDQKAQRELSDGSVVRGEYSFIQPDGYIREVQYVADDVKGFNAVVKNFLPATLVGKSRVEMKDGKEKIPCHETTKESLKEDTLVHEGHDHDNEHADEYGHMPEHEHELDHNNQSEHDHSHEHIKTSNGQSKENLEDSAETNKISKVSLEDTINHGKKVKEVPHEKQSGENSIDNPKQKSKIGSKEGMPENTNEESKEDLKEKSEKGSGGSHEKHKKSKQESMEKSIELESEKNFNEAKPIFRKHNEVHGLLPERKAIVPYNDIIRCVEAALRRSHGMPASLVTEPSPLTYIVLNQPC